MKYCPINFGDCPDCIHYKEGECQYNEEIKTKDTIKDKKRIWR